jgi:hypothetical protein
MVSSGGFGVACLLTLIWVVRFVLTRVEVAIRENTAVTRDLLVYMKSHAMYISGGNGND